MSKRPYSNHNKKALAIVNKYKDQIFTYLNAIPGEYNSITTIPSKDRNESNGYANFRFNVNELENGSSVPMVKHYNVRVETNAFDNFFIMETTKARHPHNCDILLFEYQDNLFISEKDNFGKRSWLDNKSCFSRKTITWADGSKKTYNYYKLMNLVSNGYITELVYDETENKIIYFNNLLFMLPEENSKFVDTRVTKELVNYNISTDHIERVQYDGKTAGTVFWNFANNRYTDNMAATTSLAAYLGKISTEKEINIYQKLMRAYNNTIKTGKAYLVKVKANEEYTMKTIKFEADPATMNANNEIVLAISDSDNFDIIENQVENLTDDIKTYKKNYQKNYQKTEGGKTHAAKAKIRNWLKRHNNEFNPKWTEGEKELAKAILEK